MSQALILTSNTATTASFLLASIRVLLNATIAFLLTSNTTTTSFLLASILVLLLIKNVFLFELLVFFILIEIEV